MSENREAAPEREKEGRMGRNKGREKRNDFGCRPSFAQRRGTSRWKKREGENGGRSKSESRRVSKDGHRED